jgi:hypothetical protein
MAKKVLKCLSGLMIGRNFRGTILQRGSYYGRTWEQEVLYEGDEFVQEQKDSRAGDYDLLRLAPLQDRKEQTTYYLPRVSHCNIVEIYIKSIHQTCVFHIVIRAPIFFRPIRSLEWNREGKNYPHESPN